MIIGSLISSFDADETTSAASAAVDFCCAANTAAVAEPVKITAAAAAKRRRHLIFHTRNTVHPSILLPYIPKRPREYTLSADSFAENPLWPQNRSRLRHLDARRLCFSGRKTKGNSAETEYETEHAKRHALGSGTDRPRVPADISRTRKKRRAARRRRLLAHSHFHKKQRRIQSDAALLCT